MRQRHHFSGAAVVVVAGALAVALGASPAQAGTAGGEIGGFLDVATVADYKKANDKDARLALSPQMQSAIAEKDELGKALRSGTGMSTNVSYQSNYTGNAYRQLQWNGYYCGPAAASMALGIRGITVDQGTLGYLMRTDELGQTAWSGVNAYVPTVTGRPMPDVMNYYMGWQWFYPVGLSYDPTAAEKSAYRDRLWVIDSGYPIVGDAWEVPYGPRLAGHPINQEIFHWYTIYGYADWGWTTWYMDSAGFAANNGIGALASDTITTINGGRGYLY